MHASARENVRGDADRRDQCDAANCPDEKRFRRICGGGDGERRTRLGPRRRLHDEEPWLFDRPPNGQRLDVERRVRVERRQLRERMLAQLGADERELGGEGLGNRDAHATGFGIPVHRP